MASRRLTFYVPLEVRAALARRNEETQSLLPRPATQFTAQEIAALKQALAETVAAALRRK